MSLDALYDELCVGTEFELRSKRPIPEQLIDGNLCLALLCDGVIVQSVKVTPVWRGSIIRFEHDKGSNDYTFPITRAGAYRAVLMNGTEQIKDVWAGMSMSSGDTFNLSNVAMTI